MYSPREKYINSNIVRGAPADTFLNKTSMKPPISPLKSCAISESTMPTRTWIGLVRNSPIVEFKALKMLRKDEQIVATHSTIRS